MSKKYKKVCNVLNYIENAFLWVAAMTDGLQFLLLLR